MVTTLTEEQEKLISTVRDEYLQRYFSLEFDEEKARELMNFAYDLCGYKKPTILIVDSPYGCQAHRSLLKKNITGRQIRCRIWRQIWLQMWPRLKRRIKQQLWRQVEPQMEQWVGRQLTRLMWRRIVEWMETEAQPWERRWGVDLVDLPSRERHQMEQQVDLGTLAQIWEQMEQIAKQLEERIEIKAGRQIMHEIWQQTDEQIKITILQMRVHETRPEISLEYFDNTPSTTQQARWDTEQARWDIEYVTRPSPSYSFGLDSTDYAWVAYLDYFTRTNMVDKNELFEKYKELITANIFYCLTFENVAIISRPPKLIKVDDRNRLHAVDGPAVQFNDGCELHCVHGVYFPVGLFKKVFIDQDITKEELIKIRNAEQRSIIIKKYGYEHFMKDAKVLDVYRGLSKIDNKLVTYRLLEFEAGELIIRVIELEDHTQHKKTILSVPRTLETENCLGAIAWTFGMSKTEYQPMLES